MSTPSIDIVIIGRNEGRLLGEGIASCQRALRVCEKHGYVPGKIIYVDSQSTDNSLVLAQGFGVESYCLAGILNPAAGRHLGFQHTTADYVFFMDGDMVAQPGWLPQAIKYLVAHPGVGGVAGYCDWEAYEGDRVTHFPNKNGIRRNGEPVTTDVGGGSVYRRKVLLEAGDFDPTMSRGGEFELYLRVLASGYAVVYLTVPMVLHRDQKGSMGRSFLKQSIFTKNIFIAGVVARKAPSHPACRWLLIRRYHIFLEHGLLLLTLCGVVVFGGFLPRTLQFILVGITMALLFFAHWNYKKHSFVRGVVSIVTCNVYLAAFVVGYLFQYPDIGGFYRRKERPATSA